jgi:predicted kinase
MCRWALNPGQAGYFHPAQQCVQRWQDELVSLIEIPEPALVTLVGISGSGKSTFARRHFAPGQILSSDAFRAMVADDENHLAATDDAFEILYLVARKRLRRGRLTVVDATNVQPYARANLVRIAHESGVPAVAIVLDVAVPVCWQRTRSRTDRAISRPALAGQYRDLRRSIGQLAAEGFRSVHVLTGADEVGTARVRTGDSPQ